MNGLFEFIIEPENGRYNNKKEINGKELILNTELQNHSYVNRIGLVKKVPLLNNTPIEEGDRVVIHHNVFRRWHDIRGEEKNSKSYYKENLYFVTDEQIFAFNKGNKWEAFPGYNFVKPIKETKMFAMNPERPLIGIIKTVDANLKNIKEGDLVGFKPNREYEFMIEDQRFYRVPSNSITIKYEYQGDEEEYNPSWSQSG